MRYGKAKVFLLTLLGSILLLTLPTTSPALALQSPNGSFSARDARADVRAAERHLERAEARLREARHVLSATRAYSTLYGTSVGRWVRLARRAGWQWPQLPTLMLVIHRESGGNPCARNPASTASGLLQFLASWWSSRWNPMDPKVTLAHGYRAWRDVGWAPWALTAY